MRKIKFRGKNVKTGQIHYGFYSEYPVQGGRIETCITDKNLDTWEVEPESVAQLLGYDSEGNEIYEDDIVSDEFGDEFEAGFSSLCEDGYSIGGKFNDLRLKQGRFYSDRMEEQ